MTKPTLQILETHLLDPTLWPENFHWVNKSPHHSAMILVMELWPEHIKFPAPWRLAKLFGISKREAYVLFSFTLGVNEDDFYPEDIVKRIRNL